MDGMIEVSIPVEPAVAAALDSPQKREAVGRAVSRMVRRGGEAHPLIAAMERLSAEAARRGLTDDIVDQELAAHKAEQRARANGAGTGPVRGSRFA